jgi:lipid-binding SYLF domain-containing protein
MKNRKHGYTVLVAAITLLICVSMVHGGETAAEIDAGVNIGLQTLYASTPAAAELAKVAKGILVFPDVIKGGFVVGGQYGTGALRVGGKTDGYYNTVAVSYGLQIGAQSFGYAMFLMTDAARLSLNDSKGWQVGVGPTVVVVDEGLSRSLTTMTAKDDVYVFFFDQKGLMAGLGIEGSKISKITPKQ